MQENPKGGRCLELSSCQRQWNTGHIPDPSLPKDCIGSQFLISCLRYSCSQIEHQTARLLGGGQHQLMTMQPKFAAAILGVAFVLVSTMIALLYWTLFRHQGSSPVVPDPLVATSMPSNWAPAEPTITPPGQPSINAASAKTAWTWLFLETPLEVVGWDLNRVDPRLIPVSDLFAPPLKIIVPPLPNPRRLRELMDRGVVAYASSTTKAVQVRAAYRIQAAALAGYGPAGDLIARLYPQSEAVRVAVPPGDAIRYAFEMLTARAVAPDESKRVLLAIANQFASRGELVTFTTHLVGALRDDRSPQFSHRMDTLMELLEGVRGACIALAHTVSAPEGADECTSSLNQYIIKHIQTAGPIGSRAEMRRRALQMLDQFWSTL
jgi:hypothetical protein